MSAEAVKVVVRCRPMNEREERLNCQVGRDLANGDAPVHTCSKGYMPIILHFWWKASHHNSAIILCTIINNGGTEIKDVR